MASTAHQLAPVGGFYWEDVDIEKYKASKSDEMMVYGQIKAGHIMQTKTRTRKYNTGLQIIGSLVYPRLLSTDSTRHTSCFERAILSAISHSRRMGAYKQLYVTFSPDVKDGSHSISFGTPSHARKNIIQDETYNKLWQFLTKATYPYI